MKFDLILFDENIKNDRKQENNYLNNEVNIT